MSSSQPKSDASYTTDSSAQYDTDNTADNNNVGTVVDEKKREQDFLDALEDVHTRFILNLPESELTTPEKIFFELEQAWWFYEDWICDPNDNAANLPRFSHLKPFALKMFEFSPLLPSTTEFHALWNEFAQYKRKISNYGCILLNKDCSKLILCQVWNGKSYTFPSGKINQGESGVEAAARETYEETGFDPHCQLGRTRELLASNGSVPWNHPLKEEDALSYQEPNGGKRRTSFVCCGVPEDFLFEPVCRKEVSRIEWFPVDNLPKPSFAVTPFMSQLKRWIKKHQKKKGGSNNSGKKKKRSKKDQSSRANSKPRSANKSRERSGKSGNNNNDKYSTPNRGGNNTPGSSRQGSRQGSRQRRREQDALVESGLAEEGDLSGWSEEDMFQVNEQLLGRKIEYDGNPHQFAEQGFFGGNDPHAFHVVGGSFLNSDEVVSSLAPPPEASKLQPLFRSDGDASGEEGDDDLQPFFSDEGATPWGHVVNAAKGGTADEVSTPTRAATATASSSPGGKQQQQQARAKSKGPTPGAAGMEPDVVFTDSEITKRSQATKAKRLAVASRERFHSQATREQQQQQQRAEQDPITKLKLLRAAQQKKYEADMAFIRQWVENLPKPRPTKHFGEFRLDAAAIVDKAMQGLV